MQLALRIIDDMIEPLIESLRVASKSVVTGNTMGPKVGSLTRIFDKRRGEIVASMRPASTTAAVSADTPRPSKVPAAAESSGSDIDAISLGALSLGPNRVHSDAVQTLLQRLGGGGPEGDAERAERDERNEFVRQRFEYTVARYIRNFEVHIFGSSLTGLTSSTSDVDMLLVVKNAFVASASSKHAAYEQMVNAETHLTSLRDLERVVLFLKGFIGSDFLKVFSSDKKGSKGNTGGSGQKGDEASEDGGENEDGEEEEEDDDDDEDDEEEEEGEGSAKATATSSVATATSAAAKKGGKMTYHPDDALALKHSMSDAIRTVISTYRSLILANSDEVDIVTNARRYIQQQDEREHEDKVAYLKKTMSALREDATYLRKDFVPHARVPVANFSDTSINPPVECDVIVNNLLGLHNSRMIKQYLDFDSSGKIRTFLMLVKRFASSNKINVASERTLSSYAWVVMGLHLLLRLGLLPNFQDDAVLATIPQDKRNVISGVDCTFVVPDASSPVAIDARRAIASVSLSQLVVKFFEYYTKTIDITQACITLRNKGEVILQSF